jgi:hypothetical protein
VAGRAELAIRIETLTLPSGKRHKFSPHLNSVDSGDSGQKVSGNENAVKQSGDIGKDASRIAILAGSGATIGGIADRSWKGAGIGAAAGSAVGIATTMLTRGREVELHQGMTNVIFAVHVVAISHFAASCCILQPNFDDGALFDRLSDAELQTALGNIQNPELRRRRRRSIDRNALYFPPLSGILAGSSGHGNMVRIWREMVWCNCHDVIMRTEAL